MCGIQENPRSSPGQIQDAPRTACPFLDVSFLNLIWVCSLKGEVKRYDWPGPTARKQLLEENHYPACRWLSLLIQTVRLPLREV